MIRPFSVRIINKINSTSLFVITLCATAFFALPTTSHAGVIPMPINNLGLVGYWSFEDTQDDDVIKDYSGFNNNGTPGGFSESTNHVAGYKSGYSAMSFDGNDQYVNIGTSPQFQLSSFTISSWIKPLSGGNGGVIFSTGYVDVGGNSLRNGVLQVEAGNTISFSYGNSSFVSSQIQTTAQIPDSEWSHCVLVFDGSGDVSIYINGVLQNTVASNGISYESTYYKVGLGSRIFSGGLSGLVDGELEGDLDDVRVYNRLLSPREVSLLYKTGTRVKQIAKTSNLVGYWSFDENSGTQAQDYSGNGNTGTLNGVPDWTTGKMGKALNFDGSNDYVTSPDSASLSITGQITVSAWIKTQSTGAQDIITKWHDSLGGYYLFLNPSNQLYFAVRDPYADVGPISLSMNRWYHIVATYDGTNLRLYVDGVLGASDTGGAFTDNDNDLVIGRYITATQHFDGQIDEVRIYNTALSATEIQNIYSSSKYTKINSSQNSKITDGLVGMWSFNGPDVNSTTAFDRSGNGNDGTRNGGVTAAQGKVGQAFSFDGVDDYVDIANGSTFNQTEGTISTWIYVDDIITEAGQIVSISNGSSANNYFQYYYYNNNINLALYDNAGTNLISFNNPLTYNTWVHLVFTVGSSGNNLYINGVLQNPTYTGGSSVTTSWLSALTGIDTARIGNTKYNGSNDNYFKGKMDEARIYNRALTTAEITRLYRLGR